MKKYHQSKFSKFTDWLFGMAYIVPKWKMHSYFREIRLQKKFANIYRANSENYFVHWENTLELCNEQQDDNRKLHELCTDLQENLTKSNELCTDYQNLVERYKEDTHSLERTIDSLVGELIMRGVTEEEISEMFDSQTGDTSYNSVMESVLKNRK